MIKQNTFFGLIFCLFILLVVCWKKILWVYWKYKRSKSKEQIFDLLSKNNPNFIEITGPARIGKSWGLSHVFKHLEGVKLTNLPTPKSTYTLTPQILEDHMVSNWGRPHRWYYFLDDITTFQEWTKNHLGKEGYAKMQAYIGEVAKLGGVFIWTNNGVEIDPVFATNKNATWKVQWHFKFSDSYSLLAIKTSEKWYSFLPTIIAIDNKEIESFYDEAWNIRREHHENSLKYTTKGTGAKELGAIMDKIKETNGNLDYKNDTVQLLLNYVKLRKIEEIAMRKKLKNISDLKKELEKYGLDANQRITFEDIKKWDEIDKKERQAKKGRPSDKSKQNDEEVDIDELLTQLENDSDANGEGDESLSQESNQENDSGATNN